MINQAHKQIHLNRPSISHNKISCVIPTRHQQEFAATGKEGGAGGGVALTSAIESTVVVQVVSIVVANLLLGVGEHGEGLANLLELLLLFLLHLRGRGTMPICRGWRHDAEGSNENLQEASKAAANQQTAEALTWVVQQRPFAVGLLDLILCGVLAHPQDLVVVFSLALLQFQLSPLQQLLVV